MLLLLKEAGARPAALAEAEAEAEGSQPGAEVLAAEEKEAGNQAALAAERAAMDLAKGPSVAAAWAAAGAG